MAIENEIVRFVAELELDQATKDKFIAGLEEANKNCADLRKTIADTQKSLMEMKSAGKENSEEYKKIEEHLGKLNDQYKNTSAHANRFASALGVNRMSMNQLKAYTRKLRKEMDSLHKDADPELWNKYNTLLKAAQARMKELEGGTKQTGNVLDLLNTKGGKASLVFTAIAKGARAVYNGLSRVAQETQIFGDKWKVAHAMISAGWSQLLANISSGSYVMKTSVRDAMRLAREAQELQDELFERNNSLRIQEANTRKEVAELQKDVNDATLGPLTRLNALEKLLDAEKKLAITKQGVAQQELDSALLKLSEARVNLSVTELETVVDAYNQNRDAFKLAKEYNALLLQRESYESDLVSSNSVRRNYAVARYDELTEAMSQYSDTTADYARILRQYNLSNDELIMGYVDAKIRLIEAGSIVAEKEAAQSEKMSSLKKQIAAEDARAREDAYNARIKSAEDAYGSELLKLKEQLEGKEITESQYRAKSYTAEMAMLVQKRAINEAYGKDVISVDQTIADKRLEIHNMMEAWYKSDAEDTKKMLSSMKAEADAIAAEIDAEIARITEEIANDPDLSSNPTLEAIAYKSSTQNVSKEARLADLQDSFNTEMTSLNNLHEQKLISEEEYLARKKKLTEDYATQEAAIQSEKWAANLELAMEVLNGISRAVSAAKEAEMATLDAQMEAELAAAGDNADKRAQIEAQYEAKKLDLQKRYADVDMGIQIAQSIASGAMAMIQAWNAAGGNPVLAGVIMALIGATTAAQIATIVAQRNAIQSAAPGSSGSGTNTQIRSVNGFSEGGYTGRGGRLEVAGVVHRGEYVVPQPEMRDPAVMAMVATIESKRRRRTSANALPGFAEGGYTGSASGMGRQTDHLLEQILSEIRTGNETPVPAYFVLSDLYAKQELENRMKKQTSLG